jgi:hypothetical protein
MNLFKNRILKNIGRIIKTILPYCIAKHYEKNNQDIKFNILTTNITPNIYNKNGEKMNVFFLKDSLINPYVGYSDNILWDRYNYGIETHFYIHQDILQTVGSPVKKYALLIESEEISPQDYQIFDENKGLAEEFDLIFTHSERLLNKYSNARYISSSHVWYGNHFGGGEMNNEAYKFKTKNISIISSNKSMCKLHDLRTELAFKLKKNSKVDTYGTFDGGSLVKIADTLTNYRYSIAIENNINSFYFTEKLTNCFASMTVPIYMGATQIDKFFNTDGIIQIKPEDVDNIEKILEQCNEKDYEQRLEAIKDNFNRVQNYLTIEDYIWENYLKTR